MSRRTLTLVLSVLFAAAAIDCRAQPIVTVSHNFPPNGVNNMVLNIDPNGFAFDTIVVNIAATSGIFLGEYNPNDYFYGQPGSAAETDLLGLNTVAQGWMPLTYADSPTQFSATAGPLGTNVLAPVDFLHIVATLGAEIEFNVELADDGNLVHSVSFIDYGLGVPEPTTCTLALVGLCLVGRRRR